LAAKAPFTKKDKAKLKAVAVGVRYRVSLILDANDAFWPVHVKGRVWAQLC
jgi:hypothetical protein